MGRPDDDDGEMRYINVDLDVFGSEDLAPLVKELSPKLTVLYAGEQAGLHQAHFELKRGTGDADATIRGFLRILKALSPKGRRIWKRAKSRDFNIGIQAGTHPRGLELFVGPATVRSIAAIDARIGVTVYAYGRPVRWVGEKVPRLSARKKKP